MDTKCLYCGDEIPEGRSVCPGCEAECVSESMRFYSPMDGYESGDEHKVPKTVRNMVTAILGDYRRRACELEREALAPELREHYARLNRAVDEAVRSIEVGVRLYIVRDIIIGCGYRSSRAKACMAKNTYYRRRSKLIYDIAKKLMLI